MIEKSPEIAAPDVLAGQAAPLGAEDNRTLESSQPTKPVLSKSQTIVRVLLLLLVLVITVALVVNRDRISQFEQFGYPGIFLVSLLSNATVFIPLPGAIFTSAMGAVFNPFWVAIAAGAGAALGELSGYLAGVGSQVDLNKSEKYQKVGQWIKAGKEWAILLLAFIPNPLFDAAGFIAGSTRMPVWKFLLFCAIGKIAKMLIFAYLGSSILSLFP